MFKFGSPSSKKLKVEYSNNGDLHKVIFASAGHPTNQLFLFQLDRNLKIKKLFTNIDLYIGDQVLEYNGVNLRGKTYEHFTQLLSKEKLDKKVEMVILRVNGYKGFLQPHIKVSLVFSIVLLLLLKCLILASTSSCQ